MTKTYKIESGRAMSIVRDIEHNKMALTQKVEQLQKLIEQQVESHNEMHENMLFRLADMLEVPANAAISLDTSRLLSGGVAFLDTWDPAVDKQPITHNQSKRIH